MRNLTRQRSRDSNASEGTDPIETAVNARARVSQPALSSESEEDEIVRGADSAAEERKATAEEEKKEDEAREEARRENSILEAL